MPKKQGYKSTKDIFKAISAGLKTDDMDSVLSWIENNNIKTEDGYPVKFDERRFLIDIMNDQTPKQAILSSAQLGKTVSMYIKALFMCYKGMNVMMSQPTQDLRDTLTKSKLNRIIDQNELFRSSITGDMNLKYVKDRMLFLAYTFGAAPVGYTTDLNIYDEVSRSNQNTIDILKGRQLSSKYKHEYFISNPTVPNDVLHNTFLKSDQKHWFVKCPHCNKQNMMNYDGMYGYKGNVCKERSQFVCQYCDDVLTPESIIMGQWVKRYENKDISGYWMSQLLRPTSNLEEQQRLVKELIYEEEKSKATFYSMFLGLPYAGSDVTVDKGTIMRNLVPPKKEKNFITMGMDVGTATGHHYCIGQGDTLLAIGRAKDWHEVRRLIKEYGVQIAAIDNMPELGAAKELQSEFPNIVFRSIYVPNKSEDQIKFIEEDGVVHISRNLVFDNIVNDIAQDKFKFAFHHDDSELDLFCKHWGTMSKISEFDRNGNPTFKWTAPDGAHDHFAHAFLYWRVATYRMEQIMPKFGIMKSSDGESANNGFNPHDIFNFDKEPTKDWLDL